MEAFYLNGQTAHKYRAKLQLSKALIQIDILDKDYQGDVVRWDLDQIHHHQLSDSSMTLKYGGFPHEVLEIVNPSDIQQFKSYYQDASFQNSHYNKFSKVGWKGLVLVMLFIIATVVIFYRYAVPVIAETLASWMPQEYEEVIGRNTYSYFTSFMDIDEIKTRNLQEFYYYLGYKSDYRIRLTVIESDVVNALALPGGNIIVFKGILDKINCEDELAALLAHELAHVNERHSLRIICRNFAAYLMVAVLTGDIGGFSAVIIENTNSINNLSYSRKFEQEADLIGIEYMLDAYLDPNGMIQLFEKFEQLSSKDHNRELNQDPNTDHGVEVEDSMDDVSEDDATANNDSGLLERWLDISELLSTHPSPENRIEYLIDRLNGVEILRSAHEVDSLNHYFNLLKENSFEGYF